MNMDRSYDALLVVSFGGPEGMDEVMPFLANVLRGRNVPEARMREVARHYELFGGVSPINGQNRKLIAALKTELEEKRARLGRPRRAAGREAARLLQPPGLRRPERRALARRARTSPDGASRVGARR